MKRLIVVLYTLFSMFALGAAAQSVETGRRFQLDNYPGPAHDLAIAVERQQTGRIRTLIAANASLANVREPTQGLTLLHYAVISGRYKAAEALLQSGANPNARDPKEGRSPVHEAAAKDYTAKFLHLLLAHGGDPNAETTPANPARLTDTPLILAIAARRRESVALLLQAGADLNHVTRKGRRSALGTALTWENLPLAYFFLAERKADYTVLCGETVSGRMLYVADMLRDLTPPLDSEVWRQKQQLVTFLQERGVDYKAAPIPYRVRHSFGQAYIDAY